MMATIPPSGFLPGVAYMPVPRCDQCRFWREHVPGNELPPDLPMGVWRECVRVWEADALMEFPPPLGWDCDGGGIVSRGDFGCVQWERQA